MNKYKAGESARSGPHRRFEKILDEMGLSYLSEESFPPYVVDILLPEWWVAIEIDGPFHSRNKDKIRDAYILEYYKLPIMRINAKIWITKKSIIDYVTEFIEDFADTSEQRKKESHAR